MKSNLRKDFDKSKSERQKAPQHVSDEEFIRVVDSLSKQTQRLGKSAEFKAFISKVRQQIIKKSPNDLMIGRLKKFI